MLHLPIYCKRTSLNGALVSPNKRLWKLKKGIRIGKPKRPRVPNGKKACLHGASASIFSPLLSFSDEANFCATVPKDGRSYSPTLFAQTIRVLKKINKPGNMIVAFSNLAEQIKVRWESCQSSQKSVSL